MNDETEQFERRLRRQPLRQVPREWRAEILMASPEGVGRTGGGLDFHFRREFFHAGHVTARGGKIRAAVAGGDRGTAEAAAAVCRTRRRTRAAGCRPAETLLAETAQRVRGDFADVAAGASPLQLKIMSRLTPAATK